MRTSAPGSRAVLRARAPRSAWRRIDLIGRGRTRRPRAAGFTLVELLVVVALLGLATAAVGLAFRDTTGDRLQQEAERLALLLEQARYEAQAGALAVSWAPRGGAQETASRRQDFRFSGLPPSLTPAEHWLDPEVRAEVLGAPVVVLGPEAVIGTQRIALRLGERLRIVSTQGLAPFAVQATEDAGVGPP